MKTNELINAVQTAKYQQIRIAGNGGSGKSTLAKILNGKNNYKIICTDDYLLDGEVRSKMFLDSGERVTANCIEAYDFTSLIVLLNQLQATKQPYIVEGIGAHYLNDIFFDFSIFYCVSKHEEKRRRKVRGEKFNNQSQIENFEQRRNQFEERINNNPSMYDWYIKE